MSALLAPEHLVTVVVIALITAILVIAARRRPGPWLRVFALVLVATEVSWWINLALGGGSPGQRAQALPLQLCDVTILIAAAALWTQRPLLAELTYFWGLAGTIQGLVTPDLPNHFPDFWFFQYYIAHGGIIAAALVLVVGLRIYPRRGSVMKVLAITIVYAALVGLIDAITGADYMYLRAKPYSHSLLDILGPWPWYVLSATGIAIVFFAILYAPFWVMRMAPRTAPQTSPR